MYDLTHINSWFQNLLFGILCYNYSIFRQQSLFDCSLPHAAKSNKATLPNSIKILILVFLHVSQSIVSNVPIQFSHNFSQLWSQCPIDCSAADAHVHIGRILPSKGLILDPLVHVAEGWPTGFDTGWTKNWYRIMVICCCYTVVCCDVMLLVPADHWLYTLLTVCGPFLTTKPLTHLVLRYSKFSRTVRLFESPSQYTIAENPRKPGEIPGPESPPVELLKQKLVAIGRWQRPGGSVVSQIPPPSRYILFRRPPGIGKCRSKHTMVCHESPNYVVGSMGSVCIDSRVYINMIPRGRCLDCFKRHWSVYDALCPRNIWILLQIPKKASASHFGAATSMARSGCNRMILMIIRVRSVRGFLDYLDTQNKSWTAPFILICHDLSDICWKLTCGLSGPFTKFDRVIDFKS